MNHHILIFFMSIFIWVEASASLCSLAIKDQTSTIDKKLRQGLAVRFGKQTVDSMVSFATNLDHSLGDYLHKVHMKQKSITDTSYTNFKIHADGTVALERLSLIHFDTMSYEYDDTIAALNGDPQYHIYMELIYRNSQNIADRLNRAFPKEQHIEVAVVSMHIENRGDDVEEWHYDNLPEEYFVSVQTLLAKNSKGANVTLGGTRYKFKGIFKKMANWRHNLNEAVMPTYNLNLQSGVTRGVRFGQNNGFSPLHTGQHLDLSARISIVTRYRSVSP